MIPCGFVFTLFFLVLFWKSPNQFTSVMSYNSVWDQCAGHCLTQQPQEYR